MSFALKQPCDNCPFLKAGGIRLRIARAREIANYFLDQGGGGLFPCHKTVRRRRHRQVCAGGMIFAFKHDKENQIMQVGRRLGLFHPEKLTGQALVFDSLAEMLKVQEAP